MSSDYDLLVQWRAGDGAAGNALFDRHVGAIYRFFRTKVAGELDDLVQATFEASLQSESKFRSDAPFRAFLYGIARNVLRSHYRKLTRRREVPDFSVESVADFDDSPSQVIAERREHRVLLEALRRIPLDLQIVIELHYWERLPGSEIATVLDAPEGTIRTRLRRARQLLEQRVREIAESPEVLESTVDNLERWAASLREDVAREARLR